MFWQLAPLIISIYSKMFNRFFQDTLCMIICCRLDSKLQRRFFTHGIINKQSIYVCKQPSVSTFYPNFKTQKEKTTLLKTNYTVWTNIVPNLITFQHIVFQQQCFILISITNKINKCVWELDLALKVHWMNSLLHHAVSLSATALQVYIWHRME